MKHEPKGYVGRVAQSHTEIIPFAYSWYAHRKPLIDVESAKRAETGVSVWPSDVFRSKCGYPIEVAISGRSGLGRGLARLATSP